MSRKAAFAEDQWSADDANEILRRFGPEAADRWAKGSPSWYDSLLDDAFARGGPFDTEGPWLNVGCGIGAEARYLADRVPRMVTVDLSKDMLRLAADLPQRVRADATRLPFAPGVFAGALLVNMFLFPRELDRMIAPGGHLVWINTNGNQTPIHLPAEDVARALPGEWAGQTARAGAGFWATFRRVGRH